MRNNVVLAHVYTSYIFPVKKVRLEGKDHDQNVISFDTGVKIDIPGVKFGYDVETREFVYKKDGGEWTPMDKEDNKNGND